MPRRFLTALLATALASAALGGPSVAGTSRSGTAPVTAPDTVTTWPENYAFAEVLANDSDADGDRLKICGLAPQRYKRIRADFEDPKEIAFGVGGRAQPGTYVFTYYACDGTSQTPGTVTLVVAEPPRIKVRPVPGRPGKVRATSKAAYGIRFSFGNLYTGDLDSVVFIPKHGSVVFGTRYHRLDWTARLRDGTFLRCGHLSYVP